MVNMPYMDPLDYWNNSRIHNRIVSTSPDVCKGGGSTQVGGRIEVLPSEFTGSVFLLKSLVTILWEFYIIYTDIIVICILHHNAIVDHQNK